MTVSTSVEKRSRVSMSISGLRRYPLYFGLAVLCIAATDLVIYRLHERSTRGTSHSRLVARVARDALVLAVDRESAIRGFLVTGDSESLQPEFEARVAHPAKLDSLVSLTADNPAQQQRARAIGVALQSWDDNFALSALAGRLSPATRRLAGKQLFEAVRLRFAEFVVAEEVLYEARHSRDQLLVIIAQITFLLPISLLAVLLVRVGGRLADQADQVLQHQRQLEEQAIELEQQVEELELANTELGEAIDETLSARDRAENEARERDRSNAFLKAALASTPVATSLLDTDLRYMMVNPAITRITGIPAEEHPGRTLRELNPKLNNELEIALRRVAETGTPLVDMRVTRAEVTGVSPRREMLVNSYPICSADGTILGVGGLRDRHDRAAAVAGASPPNTKAGNRRTSRRRDRP